PTYPFAKERYWVSKNELSITTTSQAVTKLHSLLDADISTSEAKCFTKLLTGKEFYLNDHRIYDVPLLPGVVYLEMVRAAGKLASVTFEVTTQDELSERMNPIIHAQGKIIYGANKAIIEPAILDIHAIKKRCTQQQTSEEIYAHNRAAGFFHGPSFQVMQDYA